ncbi:MAG: hypothetical protein Q9207_008528 [Kuettlingeria erythrocarpa]
MTNTCASCGNIGHLVCVGCVKAPAYLDDTAPTTYYCAAACQKIHWAQHKDRCKLLQRRKMLHRAAKVIQDIFYITLRKSFRVSVEKMDRVDEHTIFLHTADADVRGKNSVLRDAAPGFLSSNGSAEELVALTVNGCVNSVITMGPSIQIMLKDIVPFIFECQTVAMNRKLWVVTVSPDGSTDFKSERVERVDQHEVFLIMMHSPGVQMPDQERYAVDLTHAQYGHDDETLMPWKTYVETRVSSNKAQLPLGRARETMKELYLEKFGKEGLTFQTIFDQLERATTAAVREFPGWTKLWKEKDETAYQRQVEQILQHVSTRLDQFNASMASDEKYKLWSSSVERKRMEVDAKRTRKQKLDSWGPDLRGPAFAPAMKLIKARQAKERESWGTPEAEKKRVETRLVHALEGTDYKGPKPDGLEYPG